jgi:hypothetical protein
MAWEDLHRLQPLREVVRGLLQKGLMGEEIPQTIFSRRIQVLHQREATVRMPLGPSFDDRPFSAEPEINTQARGALDPRINPNLGSSLVPLRERVHSLRMSLLGLALSCLCQPPFLNVGTPLQDLGCARSTPQGVLLPVDVARQEAHRTSGEWVWSESLLMSPRGG